MRKLKTLAELRTENDMSQRELAEKLNISCGSVGMYESGKRNPPLSRAIEIAKLFNIPVEEIVFSSNTPINEKEKERNFAECVSKKALG